MPRKNHRTDVVADRYARARVRSRDPREVARALKALDRRTD